MAKVKGEFLKLELNGHAMIATREAGRGWLFQCPEWPEIAQRYNGAQDAEAAIAEFMTKAFTGAVTIEGLKRIVEGG